jgi:Rrf2 family protein
MFGFTKKTDYALVALARLAEEFHGGGRLSARQIAEHYGVPLPVLMNVLKDLTTGGLVRSTRGPRGGYVLARGPQAISMAEILGAMEGPVKVTPCCEETEETACLECNLVVRCPVTKSVRVLNDRIHAFLERVTLRDLMSDNLDVIGTIGRPAARIETAAPTGKGVG